jgi:hypothetical protein
VGESPACGEWLKVKSAIWAVANISLSHDGVLLVEREGAINVMINVAEKSQVFSLRGTAFYALGLVATTRCRCFLRSVTNFPVERAQEFCMARV